MIPIDSPKPRATPGDLNPSAGVIAALLGLAAGIGGLAWFIGEVSGRVFGNGSPGVGAAELPGVVLRLPQHLENPALAWPKEAQPLLPGPVAFYVVAAVCLALLAAILLVAFRVWSRLRHGARDVRDAQWATARDLAPLRVRTATAGRLTLGRIGGGLVAAEERQSALVIGPTQTGKTSGFAIPAILEWEGPVIATSVKSDLLEPVAQTTFGSPWSVRSPRQNSRSDQGL